MDTQRYLIVNADDLGQSPGVNRGIIEAHEHGIVTSASLMVRWPAATEAAAYAREHPQLSVGLHLDLGEWACRNGEWFRLYAVVKEDDVVAVAKEIEQQVAAFRRLMGKDPTHIDSHQHSHRNEPAQSIVLGLGREMGVPVRDFSAFVRYAGEFYGQMDNGVSYPEGIGPQNLLRILEELPPGCTELGCHPGHVDGLESMYLEERLIEIQT